MPVAPMLPDYDGRSIGQVLGATTSRGPGPLRDLREALAGSVGAIVVLVDGLGQLQLDVRASLAPWLAAHQLEPLTSVAPSTTAAALTTITTGVAPGVHGLVGYRFALGDDVLQALRWTVDGKDASETHPPEAVQRVEPRLVLDGRPVPYVGRREYATSSFTRSHLRGADYRGVATSEEWVETCSKAMADHRFAVAYHDVIDKTAHADGLGSTYDEALRATDQMLVALRASLPDDVAVVVTADHGQVDVGATALSPSRATLALVAKMSGEGRFRWLHAHPGEGAALRARVGDELGESCWVLSRREICDQGWLGEVADAHVDRLGDVAVIPFVDAFIPDPAEPREVGMKGRHGSLTPAEMLVPLIVG